MRKSPLLNILVAPLGLVLLGLLIYQLPPVKERLDWRMDFAITYVHNIFDPVGQMPTPLPHPQVRVTHQPTETPLVVAPLEPTQTPSPMPEVSPTPTPSPTPIPGAASLSPPEWEKQGPNNCGPTSLAMHLRYFGWEGDQEEIAALIKPLREDRNVNVEELEYFVRNRVGWLNILYRVGGDVEMLKQFIAAGLPVMIEESYYLEESYWPNDDRWAAHYQLLTGYDDSTQLFIGQDSFRGPDQKLPYAKLDEYWRAFNRVYVVIYPPEKESVVKSILGPAWDVDYSRQRALDTALAESESDPKNAYAWFNLGTNLTYFDRYSEATDAYDKALELGLPQRFLRYQFGPFMAYFHTGQMDNLDALLAYALQRTRNSEEALLWRGWASYRRGKVSDAIADFQQALQENPYYQDAQYALKYAYDNP